MKLSEIVIKNFRLLQDARMRLDTTGITTILVGPNNSGKTSTIEAMLAFLQITAAVLNLLPVPGFDGYGAIEPYLSERARASMEKIAPYGFLIVFALLFIPFLNRAFFDVVYWLFGLSGVPSVLASYGWSLFVFWR